MKIRINDHGSKSGYIGLNVGGREVTLTDVYNGVGIETDLGRFGIAQRDDGIEVMLDGELVWSSSSLGRTNDVRTIPLSKEKS